MEETKNTPNSTSEEQEQDQTIIPGFSKQETELYRSLAARYKALQRQRKAEEAFNRKADSKRDELLRRWQENGLIAENVGTDLSTPEKNFCDQIKAVYKTDLSDQKLLRFLTREKFVRSFNDRLEAASHVEGEIELVESEIDAESRS